MYSKALHLLPSHLTLGPMYPLRGAMTTNGNGNDNLKAVVPETSQGLLNYVGRLIALRGFRLFLSFKKLSVSVCNAFSRLGVSYVCLIHLCHNLLCNDAITVALGGKLS